MHRQRDLVAGRISSAPQAPYSSSKWALEAASEALAQEVKPFGVRVAIVEPGVIATPIFGKVAPETGSSVYPHSRRMAALFAAALKNPVSPYVVGEAIRRIAESESWQLRYPVGPDAGPFLAWRASMSDEDWVSSNAVHGRGVAGARQARFRPGRATVGLFVAQRNRRVHPARAPRRPGSGGARHRQ